MNVSFRLHLQARRNPARSCFGCGEHKQRWIWRRRMEEGRQIDQEVRHEFKRTGDMVHGLVGIIAHNERVRGQWPGTVRTALLQARHACQSEMGVIHNEHWVSSYT